MISRSVVQIRSPLRELVVGSFPVGVTGVSSAQVQAIAAGADLTLTVTATGVAGDALHYVSDHDADTGVVGAHAHYHSDADCAFNPIDVAGGTVAQNAWCHLLTTAGDIMIRNVTAQLGNVAANSWVVVLNPHTHLGGGVTIFEDVTNEVFSISFEEGVSTFADVVAAMAGAVRFEMCPEWAYWNVATATLHTHYTSATSTSAQVAAAINRIAAVSGIASSAGAADLMANGDAVASTHFAGGVTAVAVAAATTRGPTGTVASKGVAGYYLVTFPDYYATMEMGMAQFQFGSGTEQNLKAEVVAFSAANRAISIRVDALGVDGDGTYRAADRISYMLIMKRGA